MALPTTLNKRKSSAAPMVSGSSSISGVSPLNQSPTAILTGSSSIQGLRQGIKPSGIKDQEMLTREQQKYRRQFFQQVADIQKRYDTQNQEWKKRLGFQRDEWKNVLGLSDEEFDKQFPDITEQEKINSEQFKTMLAEQYRKFGELRKDKFETDYDKFLNEQKQKFEAENERIRTQQEEQFGRIEVEKARQEQIIEEKKRIEAEEQKKQEKKLLQKKREKDFYSGLSTAAAGYNLGAFSGSVVGAAFALAVQDASSVKSWDKEGGEEYGSRVILGILNKRTAWQMSGETVGGKNENAAFNAFVLGDPASAWLTRSGTAEKHIGWIAKSFKKHCIIITACTNPNSYEVNVTRRYRDRIMSPVTLRGYYMLAEKVVPLIYNSDKLKIFLKIHLVDSLVDTLEWKLGEKNEKPKLKSRIITAMFLTSCRVLGYTKQQFIRCNGEVF